MGMTPLHWAIKQNHEIMAIILLRAGALVNARDTVNINIYYQFYSLSYLKIGRKPIYFALKNNNINTTHILIYYNTDVNFLILIKFILIQDLVLKISFNLRFNRISIDASEDSHLKIEKSCIFI